MSVSAVSQEVDGHSPPERYVGEPPLSFSYDRRVYSDVAAWVAVCPNYYVGEDNQLVCAKSRYEVGIDPDVGTVVFSKVDGSTCTESDPDPEDTPGVHQAYEFARKKLALAGRRFVMATGDRGPSHEKAALDGPGFLAAEQGMVAQRRSYPMLRDWSIRERHRLKDRQDDS